MLYSLLHVPILDFSSVYLPDKSLSYHFQIKYEYRFFSIDQLSYSVLTRSVTANFLT